MQTWMHTSYTSWEPETYVFKQTLPLKGFGGPPDRPELAIDVGTEMGQLERASHSQIQLYNGTRFTVSLLQWKEMTNDNINSNFRTRERKGAAQAVEFVV